MKFDVVVGNPPYQGNAELHQKFFNKAVDITVDGGHVAFIQPATPYFNKKDRTGKCSKQMVENVKRWRTSVRIVNGSVFENAAIFTSLAITTLNKVANGSGNLIEYVSEDGNRYSNIDIDSVNMIQMNPRIYSSLVSKIFAARDRDGSLQDGITTTPGERKLYLQKIRGNTNKPDFYSFISSSKKYWRMETDGDYGFRVRNSNELSSVISYLTTYVARFALSIYKFNGNNHRGEFRSVPLVPFDRQWTDQQLCVWFGIIDAEYAEIIRCIPQYYGSL